MRPVRVGWIALAAEDVGGLEQTLELAGLPAELSEQPEDHEDLDAIDCLIVDVDAMNHATRRLAELREGLGTRRVPLFALTDNPEPSLDDADHIFPRPRDASELFGLVAALKFFWMSRTPSAPPTAGASLRPQPLQGVDLMNLPIEPAEAYLLSVLDGKMSLEELAAVIGVPSRRVRQMLRRLAELGAVQWNPPHPSMPPTEAQGPAWSMFPSLPPPPSLPAPPKAPAPPEANAGALDSERRRAVDEAYAMMEAEADHYELLGVPRDAPRDRIRTAYFRLAKMFHTDTVYGTDLGDYGQRMDRVFQAMTEAYEVLSRAKRRRGYDAYLSAREETTPLDEVDEVDELEEIESIELDPPAPSPAAKKDPSKRPIPAETPRASMRSMARAMGILQKSRGGDTRIERLVADAKVAEDEGNLTGAATALSLASKWRPQDVALQREAKRLHEAAVNKKVDAYAERARYAESRGNWEEAALCWTRLAVARPADAGAARHAAEAILKAKGDLRQGVGFARRLVMTDPQDPEAHRLLGKLFAAAGKPASARRALEAALRLVPDDERTRALLEQLS